MREGKVLLVGWDAADWRVIAPLLDGGHLPNLARLVESGVCGRLATIQPPLSPMLWTSIATGKRAWKHGIHGFTEVDPASGGVRPVSSLSRSCKALWNILHQSGRTCHVCGWWPSHPAEPIRGSMISNHFQPAVAPLGEPWPLRPGSVHPAALADELAALRIHPHALDGDLLRHFVPRAPEIDQEKDRRLLTLAKVLAECATVHAAATHLLLHRPGWDFAAVYYDAIDYFSHGFMRYHPPRQAWVPEADFELYQGVVNAAYVFHDMMLGALLQLAGPETTVFVVSDHGFHPDHLRPRVLPNEPAGPALEHGNYGILVAAGPGLRRDEAFAGATLLDITPTVLVTFGLPVGRDMDGAVLAGLWEKAPAVSYIDSWETVAGEAGRHPVHADQPPADPAQTLAALRQLEDLGYIEPAGDNVQQAAASAVREQRYNLARACLDGGEEAWARESFEELWNEWPDESRFGVQLLQAQIEAELPIEARQTFELLRQRKAAAAERAQKEYAEAIGKLTAQGAAAEAEPDQALAAALAALDEHERRSLRRLRARATTNPMAFAFLEGSLLALEGHPREALERLTQAARSQNLNRSSALLQMAKVYSTQRAWAAAADCCRQVLEIAPDDSTARFRLARALLALRQWAPAADEARSALGLRHHFPQAALVAGLALWRAGQTAEAGVFLERAVAQNPVYPAAQALLATYCRRVRHDARAATEHRRLAREASRRVRASAAGQRPAGVHRDEFRAAFERDAAARTSAKASRPPVAPLRQSIVVVTGLPRSGTSMLMQMLAAGGLTPLDDGQRGPDENNPRGYFEYGKVKSLRRDRSWLDEALGKAVKVVCPLVKQLPPPPPGRSYRVIVLHRPLAEVAASQRRMLERLGKDAHRLTDAALLQVFRRQLLETLTVLNRWQESGAADVLDVHYHTALSNPQETAQLLAWFLGSETAFDTAAAAAAVAPDLHREKTTPP